MKVVMPRQPKNEIIWEFGRFRLEPAELLCDGKPIPLEKRHITVLRLLVQNSPKVVTYDQFLDAWERNVVHNNVNGSIGVLRKALASKDPSQRYIETVHGIGFKFVVSPSNVTDPPPADADVTTSQPSDSASPSRLTAEVRGYLDPIGVHDIAKKWQKSGANHPRMQP